MARWGKNIVVPLESLLKEKEHTNRPTAARSAGTVGKWGKMGFTSTRTYALKVAAPTISPAQSPEGVDLKIPEAVEPPKPKKFFKSRNASVDIIKTQIIHHLPRAPPSPIREISTQQKKDTNAVKIKIIKNRGERKKSSSSDKVIIKHKKKKDEKKLKPEAPPSRVTSRHRKIVNYAEDDDDRSQTPFRDIIVPKSSEPESEQQTEIQPEPEVNEKAEVQQEKEPEPKPPEPPKEPPLPAHKPPASVDHPPIVLRISKGTSRLISTDSEDVLNSPIRETSVPELPPTTEIKHIQPNEVEPTAAVVNEMSQLNFSNIQTKELQVNSEIIKSPEQPPRQERLKIVIKADVLKNAKISEKSEKKSKSRKHHKNSTLKIVEHQFKTPSPQPLAENFELGKPLAPSPSERDFDSQSSILGSISSKETNQFPAVITDENCVIRSRGSSDVTSDLETSQHSSLVAPPSDIESRLESMMDGDDDEPAIALENANSLLDDVLQLQTEPLKEDILEVLTGEIESTNTVEDDRKSSSDMELEIDIPPIEEVKSTSEQSPNKNGNEQQQSPQKNEGEQSPNKSDSEQLEQSQENNTVLEIEKELQPEVEKKVEPEVEHEVTTKRVTRSRRGAPKIEAIEPSVEVPVKMGRVTRNNNNGSLRAKAPIRSYAIKKKRNQHPIPDAELNLQETSTIDEPVINDNKIEENTNSIDLPDAPILNTAIALPEPEESIEKLHAPEITEKEYKIKNKFKRTWYEREAKNREFDQNQEPATKKSYTNNEETLNLRNRSSKIINNNNTESGDIPDGEGSINDDEKRSVKLVISKKKGSIFKSRALVADQGDTKKRHVYKHTWDADERKEKGAPSEAKPASSAAESIFDDDFNNIESTSKLTRLTRQTAGKFDTETVTSVKCDRRAKEYYTVVRNVKTAHQIQEIGEYQEMDDDVEYILDALQPHNPIPTRCLSALQLASKCMTPAFRMHVRAHGTVTKFFKALRDSNNDISLGLCTATIMFVLSQDTLNIDLDRDSLELMMNLLEADASNPIDEGGIANFERNKQKVRELCEEIKSQGKAAHLNIESISAGTLAMETLLSLTSKRAGEWFKEELRELGGLEHIIKTICECCHQISDYVVSWTEVLLDKLRTIERCLRVLENVSQQNEKNQEYILSYSDGHAVNTLFKLYKLCDTEIALYPTTDATPKENPGVVLREALVPTLKVLINLTHPFDSRAVGSAILGGREGIFDTSFHILLQAPNYIPERCIFELSILVLLLLINLTMYTIPNRTLIMQSHAPSDFGNQFDKIPAIKALIEYFYKCEEQARLAEKNTDAILENPETTAKKPQSQEEVNETVTKLLQKAGHHMEHTMQASYAGLLIGYLISDSEENEQEIRTYLRENSFKDIVSILEKYYNFMNLTASSEAIVVSHIKSTRKIIDYFKQCDAHSNTGSEKQDQIELASTSSISTRSTPRVYKTYSQR